jgi:transcriptional regulator with XRE-family HTH domain
LTRGAATRTLRARPSRGALVDRRRIRLRNDSRQRPIQPPPPPDLEPTEIGARIRVAREVAGLTQEELARAASFSKRSLQDYEAGAVVPFKHFRELGRLLERDTEWFLHGDATRLADEEIRQLQEEVQALRDQLDEVLALLRNEGPATGEASD